jgi:signal transduction histidine kinase
MPEPLFEELKSLIDFSPADEANLRLLAEPLDARIDHIAEQLYNKLQAHPAARSAIRESGASETRVRSTIADWLVGLLEGPYDQEYYQRRVRVGLVHARMRLPQHFMVAAMHLVRRALVDAVWDLPLHPDDKLAKVRSVHKIVDIETAVIMENFREGYAERVRQAERETVKERLRESEHLANIGQLAAALAHEIKNPLAGISGAIQVIAGDLAPDDSRRDVVDEILAQIDRMDATVRDLLVYARPKPPERQVHGVGAAVQRALTLLREEPAFDGIEVHREGLDCDVEALIDPSQFQQVITNVLLNAAQACNQRGEITVRLSRDNSAARVEVADTGGGMTRAEAERAFEPFFTTKARGTGLGLPICKRIMDAHDGRIRLQSREGKGTRVVIELPVSL